MSAPFDYAAWVERARRYVESLARLPGAVVLDCHYVFEPRDGVLHDSLPDQNCIFGGAPLGPLLL